MNKCYSFVPNSITIQVHPRSNDFWKNQSTRFLQEYQCSNWKFKYSSLVKLNKPKNFKNFLSGKEGIYKRQINKLAKKKENVSIINHSAVALQRIRKIHFIFATLELFTTLLLSPPIPQAYKYQGQPFSFENRHPSS